jgi:hypothetical protein
MTQIDLDILNEAIEILRKYPEDIPVWKEQSKIIKDVLKRIKPTYKEVVK